MKNLEFSLRFSGIRFEFFCEPSPSPQRHIRKARALGIGGTVIAAQPSQSWRLNNSGTGWLYYAASVIGPVPIADVQWALADNRRLIETYSGGQRKQWRITEIRTQCYRCLSPLSPHSLFWHPYLGMGPQPGYIQKKRWVFWTPVCTNCIAQFDRLWRMENIDQREDTDAWGFLSNPEVNTLASSDRSSNVRWVRKYCAPGSFKPSEFRKLCAAYGNVCLRCGKSNPLVADHVIPLAKGGSNTITNIQPLCARCNGIKSDKSTDYRNCRLAKRHFQGGHQ